MYCEKCGAQMAEDSRFCTVCGKPVNANMDSNPVKPMVNNEYKPSNETIDIDLAESIAEDVVGKNVPDSSIEPLVTPENKVENSQGAPAVEPVKPKKGHFKIIIAIIAVLLVLGVIVCSVLGFVIFNAIGKANLKNELLKDWSRVESSGSTYATLELDFFEDTIDYNFESYYFDEKIAEFDYEVIGKNKIKIDSSTVHTIEFNDDKSMMIVTPAITSTDAVEYWYNLSDY